MCVCVTVNHIQSRCRFGVVCNRNILNAKALFLLLVQILQFHLDLLTKISLNGAAAIIQIRDEEFIKFFYIVLQIQHCPSLNIN